MGGYVARTAATPTGLNIAAGKLGFNYGTLALVQRFQAAQPLSLPRGLAVQKLHLAVIGKYVNTSNVSANIPQTHTYEATLEVAKDAIVTPARFTWATSESKSVAAGDALALSDDWCVANGAIAEGAKALMRIDEQVATAATGLVQSLAAELYNGQNNSSTLEQRGITFVTGADSTNDIDARTRFSATGGTQTTAAIPGLLQAVIAEFDKTICSAVIFGNSRHAPSTNVAVTNGLGDQRAIARALTRLGVPYTNMAISGSRQSHWAAWDADLFEICGYATDIFIGDHVNDFNVLSEASMQTNYTTLVGKIRTANPTANIWAIKSEPYTTGAWSLPDGSDQTVTAQEARRVAMNAWYDTQVSAGLLLTGVLDPNTKSEIGGSGASGKWIPEWGPDGLHNGDMANERQADNYYRQLQAQSFLTL